MIYNEFTFYFPRQYVKTLNHEDIISYSGKNKLVILKIRRNKYLKVSDILGGNDKIAQDTIYFGNYKNKIKI